MQHGSHFDLPAGLSIFERGWLSSNSILLHGGENCALVDSGYCTHAPQTLELVAAALNGRALDLLINTHLHSDHCGGNAALQAQYPALITYIPPGQAEHVRQWDPYALSYTPTGQQCPQYKFDGVLNPGAEMRLGSATWQVHAAPGHDPHSVILFEAVSRVLISADALWEAGFGVVFPELDGDDAFDAVGDTLNLIEFLNPAVVIPGHGAAFADLQGALERARRRLDGFVANPQKHLQYATKVLLKFKLLDAQRMERSALEQWIQSTAYFAAMVRKQAAVNEVGPAMDALIQDLVRSGAAGVEGNIVYNI